VQWTTPHLRSLGAVDVPRREYLRLLDESIRVGSAPDADDEARTSMVHQ
jgi:Leu/Phe-tRNA-protein transferase